MVYFYPSSYTFTVLKQTDLGEMSNHTYMFRVYGKYTNTRSISPTFLLRFYNLNILDTFPIMVHLKISSLA